MSMQPSINAEPFDDSVKGSVRIRYLIARVSEGLVGLVLIIAGLAKAYYPLSFVQNISTYKIITVPLVVTAFAWLMIIIEGALGMALVTAYQRRWTVPITISLLVLFLGVLGWAWYSGSTADCGCFGPLVKRTPQQAFFEDLILLAVLVAAQLLDRSERKSYQSMRLTAVAAVAMLCLIVTTVRSLSPEQSADPVTRLKVSQPSPFQSVTIQDLSVDIQQGRYLVALIDTGCDHCQQSVPDFNKFYSQQSEYPTLVAICPNSQLDVKIFQEKFGAQFPIGRITNDDFLRLVELGSTPRVFLLQDGQVLKIWDGSMPSGNEVKTMLEKTVH
ncbi:MAG: MauE/DoxX family redox-associated membrane protein [Acidobacteriota bacterium]